MKRLFLCYLMLAACLWAQPRRIISTAPSITEMLFALGLGDRVVGVTNYCHYPAATAKITKIGTFMKPDIETILSLKPDLIVMQKTKVHSKSQFEPYHLKVLEVSQDNVAEILTAISAIGNANGVADRARTLTQSISRELDSVHRKVAAKPATSVVFIVGRTPNEMEGMVAVGS